MTSNYDIKLFGMGGTIDKVVYSYDHLNYIVDAPQAERILAGSNLTLRVSVESVTRKDSLELIDADRSLLREKILTEPCSRIIVTHGTDTIPESAKALGTLPGKTVVFTGAMLPARFYDSDATFNLGGAVTAVQALSPGIYLVMHGRILDPLRSTKDRANSRISG